MERILFQIIHRDHPSFIATKFSQGKFDQPLAVGVLLNFGPLAHNTGPISNFKNLNLWNHRLMNHDIVINISLRDDKKVTFCKTRFAFLHTMDELVHEP
jgi:hypothetical protein